MNYCLGPTETTFATAFPIPQNSSRCADSSPTYGTRVRLETEIGQRSKTFQFRPKQVVGTQHTPSTAVRNLRLSKTLDIGVQPHPQSPETRSDPTAAHPAW